MARYIDADAFKKVIGDETKLRRTICAAIDAQPTAFDMDAVEAELKVLRDLSNADQQLVVSQAIGIVKRGGMK